MEDKQTQQPYSVAKSVSLAVFSNISGSLHFPSIFHFINIKSNIKKHLSKVS